MREKYETLAISDLRAIAKIRGIKGASSMSKAKIIDVMVQLDAEEAAAKEEKASETVSEAVKEPSDTGTKKTSARKAKPVKETVAEPEKEAAGQKNAVTAEKKPVKTARKEESLAEATGKPAKKTRGGSKAEAGKAPEIKDGQEVKTAEKVAQADNMALDQAKTQETAAADATAVPQEKARDAQAKSGERKRGRTPGKTANKANKAEKPADLEKESDAETATDNKDRSADQKEGTKPIRQKAEANAEAGTGAKTEEKAETKADNRPENREEQRQEARQGHSEENAKEEKKEERKTPDNLPPAHGILEVMSDGYGFIRCDNFLPGADDVYVAPGMIRKYGLRTGDILDGFTKVKSANEKFSALLYISSVNGYRPDEILKRVSFENMTPIFPDHRIRFEMPGSTVAMRVMDLLSPVGKGQRGMIVSPPKAGKTTLLKEVAKSVKRNNPEIHMIILLIDERPEEVTDIKEAIEGPNVEVIYSTFDETPEHHKRVSEMVIERAKRLVEHHRDVMILLDSITRLTRAYNLTVQPSGRTLSGGLDPAALHMPKKFFGAARNMREGGSLTILATALVETGSKMDDVVYEEFKGTGNMEMVLDRKLSEKRIFPAIDIAKSGTRREDLLLSKEEMDAVNTLRKGINGLRPDESVDKILDMFSKTRGNQDFIHMVNKIQLF